MSRIPHTTEITVERGPFEMVPHWLLESDVSAAAIRLYLVLRMHGNASGVSFPGRKRLAEVTRLGIKTIDRAKSELLEAGAMCWTRRHGENGDWTSNLYHVHWESSLACTVFDATSGQKGITGRVKNDPLTYTQINLDPPKEYIDRFEEFWNVYPKKVARKKAHEAWKRVTRKHNRQMLIEAAQAYRDDPNRDPEFTLNPTTWLNQERWEDEVEKPKLSGPVTVMDLYAAEPCEHGDPMGEARCALCRNK